MVQGPELCHQEQTPYLIKIRMTENGGRKVPKKGEGGFPTPPPGQKPTFRTQKSVLDFESTFNYALIVHNSSNWA